MNRDEERSRMIPKANLRLSCTNQLMCKHVLLYISPYTHTPYIEMEKRIKSTLYMKIKSINKNLNGILDIFFLYIYIYIYS